MTNAENYDCINDAAMEFENRCRDMEGGDCTRCRYEPYALFGVKCFAEWLNAETPILELDKTEETE